MGTAMTATPQSVDLVGRLRRTAEAAGFAACGVARAEVAPHAESLESWIREGNHADMNWMARSLERRKDPRQVLPDCRSVIVLAANYWQGAAPRSGGGPAVRGRIARYAWGDDYHDVLRARMESLDALLMGAGGTQKCYVDTGHVLERDFSAIAGLSCRPGRKIRSSCRMRRSWKRPTGVQSGVASWMARGS